MLDCRAATLNTVSPPLRDSYPATIMPLPRCRIPILTVAGLIEIAALHVELIAAHAGMIIDSAGEPQKVNRAAPNAPSVIYDAVVVPGGSSVAALAKSGLAIHFLNEAYRHGKPIAAISDGSVLLDACSLGETKAQDGVIVGEGANAIDDLIAALLQHRFPRRLISGVPA
ncbi:MAG: DJ-1/PfpI family protein [Stellaceae bacterium]